MIGIDIAVPQRDLDNMSAAFKRFVTHFRGNVPKAVEKTLVQIIKSLSGSTKVSAKIRPIVKNPDPRAKTDARRAPFGVYKYSNKKEPRKYFSPIRGTGEYGAAIRYVGRDKILVRVRGGWETYTRAEFESMNLGSRTLQNHPKRKIGRSGVAKASWVWMLGKLGASATTSHQVIPGTTAVTRIETGGAFELFALLAENKLRYIRRALHGREDVSTVIQRATNNMRSMMGELPRKSAASAGLRAA